MHRVCWQLNNLGQSIERYNLGFRGPVFVEIQNSWQKLGTCCFQSLFFFLREHCAFAVSLLSESAINLVLLFLRSIVFFSFFSFFPARVAVKDFSQFLLKREIPNDKRCSCYKSNNKTHFSLGMLVFPCQLQNLKLKKKILISFLFTTGYPEKQNVMKS